MEVKNGKCRCKKFLVFKEKEYQCSFLKTVLEIVLCNLYNLCIKGAEQSFLNWIMEDIDKISCGNIFKMAPFFRHSIADVVFFHAWLTKFSAGTQVSLKGAI